MSQADVFINWAQLREQLAGSSPLRVTALFATLFTVWGIIAGGSLPPVWRQPAIAFVVSQPLSRWQWVQYLLPTLSIAFVPIAVIWWLAPHYLGAPLHYVGFIALAWTTILGASFHGVVAAKWIAILSAIASVALLPLTPDRVRASET